MSAWNHSICEACWVRRCEARGEPGRRAVRMREPRETRCCWCGESHQSGILVQEDPAVLRCRGAHA